MRMLTAEEREWLAEDVFDGPETDESTALGDELERVGRAKWLPHPYRPNMLHSYTTDMGLKALRIDALIRGLT